MRILSNWRLRHFVGALLLYWVSLLAATVWGIASHVRRVVRPERKTSTQFVYEDARFSLAVIDEGRAAIALEASMFETAFWVLAPPMLLYVLWISARPFRTPLPALIEERALGGGGFEGVSLAPRDREPL